MNQKTLKALEYDKILDILKQKTKSQPGKQYFDSLVPSTDLSFIESELNRLDEAYRYILKYGNPPALDFIDILPSLRKAKLESTLSPYEILSILRVLKLALQLKDYLSSSQDFEYLGKVRSNLINFKVLIDKIEKTFLSAEEILDTATPTLKQIRDNIRKSESRIREVLNSMIRDPKIQRFLQEPIITIRADKLLLPVKSEYRNEIKGIIHDQSATGSTLFVEPYVCVEVSNQIRILKNQEKEEIEKILKEISQMIANESEKIESNYYILFNLDVIFTKALYAIEQDASKPILNTNGIINLKKARHPLIEKEKVVPIDISLGIDFDALIITGPNTGGKTVTLKTVGLFCLMVQSAMFIPASEGSEVCIFQKVFADIGDEQSIAQSLSTFSAHMKNIIEIINNADSNTLVLIDEIGAGTDPEEGAALGKAILKFLHKKGCKIIATTHYGELKIFAEKEERFENASCEFDINTLKPTYRLLIGIPGRSNAIIISSNLGLSDEVIEMAKSYVSQSTTELNEIINQMELKNKEAEKNLFESRMIKIEAEALKQRLEDEKQRFEKEKERIRQKAIEKAKDIVDRAESQIESLFKELKKIAENLKEKELIRQLEEKKNEYESLAKSIHEYSDKVRDNKSAKIPKSVYLGQKIYVKSFDAVGFVDSLPDSKGNLTVQIGIMKLNVNLSDIEEIEHDKVNISNTPSKKVEITKKSVDMSIDVRGKNVDDAILDIDKYLDDAYTLGLKEVVIIHGKGTGTLRQAVRQYLKKHVHVKSYRDGTYGEGEQGVTVVQLKD